MGIEAAGCSAGCPDGAGSGAAVPESMSVRVSAVGGSWLAAGANGVAREGLRPRRRSRWLSGS